MPRSSDVNLFRYGQGIIDFNAEILTVLSIFRRPDRRHRRPLYPIISIPLTFMDRACTNYMLVPTHLDTMSRGAEITTARLHDAFDFTKGMPLLQINALKAWRIPIHDRKLLDPGVGTALYDIVADPQQLRSFRDAVIERRIHAGIAIEMRAHHAPAGLFERYAIAV